MFRTITLSLLMLISVVAMLPFASSNAHGIRTSASSSNRRYYRRHSRAWWRRYRARLRRKREAAAFALAAHRNRFLELPSLPNLPRISSLSDPLGLLPNTRLNSTIPASSADIKFRVEKGVAPVPGNVSLAVVALSRPNPAYLTAREQSRMLSGINVAELRRIVIDKMITANGWVTNDYVREVGGQRVFVVTAQTPADNRSAAKVWNFYFTEVNGRIYNLTTSTSAEFAVRMEVEAERFIDSLRSSGALPPTKR
jgi:hypothetical protein